MASVSVAAPRSRLARVSLSCDKRTFFLTFRLVVPMRRARECTVAMYTPYRWMEAHFSSGTPRPETTVTLSGIVTQPGAASDSEEMQLRYSV